MATGDVEEWQWRRFGAGVKVLVGAVLTWITCSLKLCAPLKEEDRGSPGQ